MIDNGSTISTEFCFVQVVPIVDIDALPLRVGIFAS